MAIVRELLSEIRQKVRHQQGDDLRRLLQVEPGASPQYGQLAQELRSHFATQASVDGVVEACLPQEDNVPDGQATAWPGFQSFMKDYLVFWRDIDYDDLLGSHQLLSGLVNSCSTAFAHPTYGAMLLQASMSLSETLARFTMNLNRRPDLLRKLHAAAAATATGGDDDSSSKSVAESTAEIIQKIFTTCLTDRSGGGRYSKPEGKRTGVYMFANLVLKLLFACRRTHLAKMIFVNISSISPPLALYPAAQRVTFLYYLGRFNLANAHFRRAALCLEAAYLQTPRAALSHRAAILTYLIPSNILLGRFPSRELLARPEAAGSSSSSSRGARASLAAVFLPLCQAVRAGDFAAFQAHVAAHEDWLFERGLLLPLSSRLRPLLWRALSRRAFVLTYVPPADAASRKAATLDLADLHALAVYMQRRIEGWLPAHPSGMHHHHHHHHHGRRPPHGNALLMRAVANNIVDSGATTLAPPPGGPVRLRPHQGLVWGNAEVTFEDVEMMVAALVEQGLMHGFVAHGQGRFAIIGAKAKGSPVLAGWPNVWRAIQDRRYEGSFDLDEVPGWVKG